MAVRVNKRIVSYDWTQTVDSEQGVYELSTAKVHPAYTPASTDIITVSALNYPTDGIFQTLPGRGDVNCWVQWDSSNSVWKIYVSDATFTGVVEYRLQSIR